MTACIMDTLNLLAKPLGTLEMHHDSVLMVLDIYLEQCITGCVLNLWNFFSAFSSIFSFLARWTIISLLNAEFSIQAKHIGHMDQWWIVRITSDKIYLSLFNSCKTDYVHSIVFHFSFSEKVKEHSYLNKGSEGVYNFTTAKPQWSHMGNWKWWKLKLEWKSNKVNIL